MGNKIHEVVTVCCTKSKECFDIIFHSAAENHIQLAKRDASGRFQSYIQLKKYQQRIRLLTIKILMAAIFLLIGILVGPAVFNREELHDIYIPDGKGDILIGNVSKNKATIVFKTMDTLHQNKPLATVAEVKIYRDLSHKDLVQEAYSDGYAVTHVISLDGLVDGTTYYPVISVSEDKDFNGTKEISAWGGTDPIAIYATGETASSCVTEIKKIQEEYARLEKDKEKTKLHILNPEAIAEITTPTVIDENPIIVDPTFKILGVQNENYLYGKDKLQIIISWKTNMPATAKLLYRYDDNGEKKEELNVSKEKATKHVAVLTTLKTETKYYFKVMSTNEKGENVVSEEYSLQTPHAKDTISDIIVNNLKELTHQVGL